MDNYSDLLIMTMLIRFPRLCTYILLNNVKLYTKMKKHHDIKVMKVKISATLRIKKTFVNETY